MKAHYDKSRDMSVTSKSTRHAVMKLAVTSVKAVTSYPEIKTHVTKDHTGKPVEGQVPHSIQRHGGRCQAGDAW